MFWKIPLSLILAHLAIRLKVLRRIISSEKFSLGMIGRFSSQREEDKEKRFHFVVANGSCAMDSDLKGCLMLRNIAIDSKKDEKRQKTETEKLPKEHLAKNWAEVTTALDIIRNSTRITFARSEILKEGTALNCKNLFQNTDGVKTAPDHEEFSVEEFIACSHKDDSQANLNAVNTERIFIDSPEMSLNTLDERSDQDNENDASSLGSPKAIHRSLNPSPWKEVWSALQDRSLATCLSTKSMEFGRGDPGTSFSTRTNPYSRQRREKPQRIPPLYNKRKSVPTTRDNKTQISASFDDAVIFNSVIRDIRRSQDSVIGVDDIGKCKKSTHTMEFKDNNVQIESDESGRCGKRESNGVKDKIIGLPQITPRPPTVRYRSKFRVRLLPLVAKSDSLPNLTPSTTSAPSELIVTAPMNAASSNENVRLDCHKNEERITNPVTEPGQLMNRQSRCMSLDSVFSVESFPACQEKKDKAGINVQGFQVLPDITQIEPKKYQSDLKQNNAGISGISQTPVTTLPWK